MKKLGFGLMRLPKKDGMIDLEQVKIMVDAFMENGFTYIFINRYINYIIMKKFLNNNF